MALSLSAPSALSDGPWVFPYNAMLFRETLSPINRTSQSANEMHPLELDAHVAYFAD